MEKGKREPSLLLSGKNGKLCSGDSHILDLIRKKEEGPGGESGFRGRAGSTDSQVGKV